jgi:hypothetical protein
MPPRNRPDGRTAQAKKKPRHQPLTRAAYDALDEDTRKIVDFLRHGLAEALAKHSGFPLDEVLQSVIALHERGHLKMVSRDGRISLQPCFKDGTLVDSDAGGRP